MEPRFQSSFIPKGPLASTSEPFARQGAQRDLVSIAAKGIFALAVLAAVGVFGYKFYLGYSIEQMGMELESARANLSTDTVNELIRLNNRIVSTQQIINRHKVLSTVFDFLESATPQSVRYTEFNYLTDNKGVTLTLRGEARGYAALAQAAEVFNKSNYFKNPAFSDLNLDERGNVVFSMTSSVEGDILSYQKLVERIGKPAAQNLSFPAASSPSATTSTSTLPTGSSRSSSTSTNPLR